MFAVCVLGFKSGSFIGATPRAHLETEIDLPTHIHRLSRSPADDPVFQISAREEEDDFDADLKRDHVDYGEEARASSSSGFSHPPSDEGKRTCRPSDWANAGETTVVIK